MLVKRPRRDSHFCVAELETLINKFNHRKDQNRNSSQVRQFPFPPCATIQVQFPIIEEETMTALTDLRPSPLAGSWYPADQSRLAKSVDQYLAEAELPAIEGDILGVVTPHAGHRFSGSVAGHAFAVLRGQRPDLVVIASPFHQAHAAGLLTTGHDGYQTPLGSVPVDQQALREVEQALEEKTGLSLTRVKQDREHAVEIELPFLQRVLADDFSLLPLMIRQQDPEIMHILGSILADLLAERDGLLVASTDLSHFYTAEQARELDQTMIDHITALNPQGLYRAEEKEKGFACGKGALAAVLWAAREVGANRAYHLAYSHSGRITGDNSRVVGYAAAALVRQ